MRRMMPLVCLLAAGCEAYTYDTVTLSTDATDVEILRLDIGNGDLYLHGDPAATEIVVYATIQGFGADPCPVKQSLQLSLEPIDGVAWLDAYFSAEHEGGGWVDLDVTVPAGISVEGSDGTGDAYFELIGGLSLIDGTGDLSVRDVRGDVRIDDGTGDIWIDGVGGDISIVDGTGDIVVSDAHGDVTIDDGTGDIVLESVGAVTIWDGSGDIVVRGARDVDVVSDGSGDVIIR